MHFSFRKYRLSLPRKGFARSYLRILARPSGTPLYFFSFDYFPFKYLAFATTNRRPFEFPLTSPGKKRIFSGTALSLSVYNIQILKSLFYGVNSYSSFRITMILSPGGILSDIALVLDNHNIVLWAFKEQAKVAHDNLLLPGQISLIVQSLIRAQPCCQCIL